MTTIAYRDGVLAADSLVNSSNGASCGTVHKIGKVGGHKLLWGFSGDLARMEAFVAWANGKRDGDPPTWGDDCGVGILVNHQGPREWWGDGWAQYDAPFYAWGSGERIALGAMWAGADAARAVEIAANIDSQSGLPVRVLK